MSCCEPCQSLTAAALSKFRRVPRGNFEGATYAVSASVLVVGDGAQYLKREQNLLPFQIPFFFFFFFLKLIFLSIFLLITLNFIFLYFAMFSQNRQFISRFSNVKAPISEVIKIYANGISVTSSVSFAVNFAA